MKMRKNFISVLAVLLVLLLTMGSFGAAFAETAATTKPLGELTQEDIDYLRSLLETEDGPLMGEELLAHINSFTGEKLYWTLAAVSDEQYASLQEILSEDELTALFAPLNDVVYVAPRDYTKVAPLMDFGTAPYALRSSGNSNQSETKGLYLNKSATFDPESKTGTITMEAYVEGSVSTSTTIKPCDIVLVLDVSGSMEYAFRSLEMVYTIDTNATYYTAEGDKITYHTKWGTVAEEDWDGKGWYAAWGNDKHSKVTPKESATDSNKNRIQFYVESSSTDTRLKGLQEAATKFVNDIADDAKTKDVDHRVAIVTFGTNAKVVQDLVSINNEGTEAALKDAIAGFSGAGATRADRAMTTAVGVIEGTKQNNAVPADRVRVVVMFTDGEPTTADYFEAPIADGAVANAQALKTTLDTTVYTIGIFEGANPEVDDDKNNYMNGVSSNYPNATAYTSLGTGSRTAGYYLSASNSSALKNIFSKIATNVMSGTASVKLNANAVITDTLSATFELPEGTDASKIKVYTQASTAEGTWAKNRVQLKTTGSNKDVTVTINGKSVSVKGFDFQANYVGEHAVDEGASKKWGGKKLIIEIPFKTVEGHFGGNKVKTNAKATIAQDKFSEEFGDPTVDVPLDYQIATQDQAIYLSNVADLEAIKKDVVGYVANGTNNSEVNIVYTLKNSAGDAIATLTIPQDTAASACKWVWTGSKNPALNADETYTLECVVTPVATGTYSALTCTPAAATTYVYKPQVTANDAVVDYGADATLTDYIEDVAWIHPTATIAASGAAPDVSLQIDVTGEDVTEDTPVNITAVLLGEDQETVKFDFTRYTTFIRNATACAFHDCSAKEQSTHMGDSEECEFMLHLGTVNVKVTKTVTGNMANVNQAFNFTATYGDATETFALKHGETYELKNLPIGETLTITEANAGYITTIDGEASENATYTDAIDVTDAEKTVAFNNYKEALIDTGVSLDTLPYILMMAAALGGMALLMIRRKRRED